MTKQVFFKQLAIIAVLVGLAIGGLHTIEQLYPHQSLSWISWGFFILFCWAMFVIGSKSANSENKNLFGQLFLVSTFFKMLLSILIIVGYAILTKPTDFYFVLPFFAIYTIFTIYEIYFMTKLAKPTK